MDINKLIKECYENAVEKGFYNCSGCKGIGLYYQKYPDCKNCEAVQECGGANQEYCCISSVCDFCNGTKINQNKNIPELLMLVITEIGRAADCFHNKYFSNWKLYHIEESKYKNDGLDVGIISDYHKDFIYDSCIKNSFEDKIADVFIRIFELCGYLKLEIKIDPHHNNLRVDKIFECSDLLLFIVRVIADIQRSTTDIKNNIECAFSYLFDIVKKYNIDIEKHIDAKMAYSKTK